MRKNVTGLKTYCAGGNCKDFHCSSSCIATIALADRVGRRRRGEAGGSVKAGIGNM